MVRRLDTVGGKDMGGMLREAGGGAGPELPMLHAAKCDWQVCALCTDVHSPNKMAAAAK